MDETGKMELEVAKKNKKILASFGILPNPFFNTKSDYNNNEDENVYAQFR